MDGSAVTANPELYHLPGFYHPFSAMSHLLGAVAFFIYGIFLLRRGRGSASRLFFLGVYVFSGIFLFSMSAVYHMLEVKGAPWRVFERLDHCAIFVLIAGSFTPVHGILFRGFWRWFPLLFVWACAITGLTLKTIFFNEMPEWLGLTFYLSLGWIGALSGIALYHRYGSNFIQPLMLGGVAYSIGALLEYLNFRVLIPGVIHPHEIWHVMVIIGAACQAFFVWEFADGTIHPIGDRQHVEVGIPNEPHDLLPDLIS
jgi:channel protein (hemolysin III family)